MAADDVTGPTNMGESNQSLRYHLSLITLSRVELAVNFVICSRKSPIHADSQDFIRTL